jgi:hypothetical protein
MVSFARPFSFSLRLLPIRCQVWTLPDLCSCRYNLFIRSQRALRPPGAGFFMDTLSVGPPLFQEAFR